MAGAAKTERQDEIRQQIKDGCRERARVMASGELEQLRERIDHPEDIVAHAIAFIAVNSRLTDAEINGEDGLLDF